MGGLIGLFWIFSNDTIFISLVDMYFTGLNELGHTDRKKLHIPKFKPFLLRQSRRRNSRLRIKIVDCE